MTRRWWALGVGAVFATATPAAAQIEVRDFVLTGGASVEGYQGNLAAVTLPVVDSTDRASAAVGEFGARGRLVFLENGDRSLRLDFDGGLRQFAAAGFEIRDYAPREWVGRADLRLWHRLGEVGGFQLTAGARGRQVHDRPPMPLFLQPGYGSAYGAMSFQSRRFEGVRLDAEVRAETSDYGSLEFAPQLDLLDHRAAGMEVGAEWGEAWTLRFFGGYRLSRYPHQTTFEPTDPFRRDRTVRAGATWTLTVPVLAQVSVEGTVNRSNSARPEYDAVTVRTLLATPITDQFSLTVYAALTGKSYVVESDFARLVPGEEADNASLAYVSLNRPLAPNLDGQLRFGWTRAETDIGTSYYQRYGLSFLLNYRP